MFVPENMISRGCFLFQPSLKMDDFVEIIDSLKIATKQINSFFSQIKPDKDKIHMKAVENCEI